MKRYRMLRHANKRLRTAVGMLILSLLLMGVANISMGYQLSKSMAEVKKQQEDTLNTLMYHRIETEPIFNSTTRPNEKQEAESVSEYTLTDEERELAIRVCMAEAGANEEGLLAVAQCIHDRAILRGQTVKEVLTAKAQFAKPRQGELYPEAMEAVKAVFDDGEIAFDGDVTHFHAESISPYWVDGMECLGNRGGNIFYRSE